MKNLSRMFSMLWTAVSTAPVWGPALLVMAVLHLIGWADFSDNRATVDGELRQVGVMWTLELPTHWIPFVESTLILALGFRWLPSSWGFSITRLSVSGGPFVHAVFGLLDLTFSFVPVREVVLDA